MPFDTCTFCLKQLSVLIKTVTALVKFTNNLYLNSLYVKYRNYVFPHFPCWGCQAVQVSSTSCNSLKFVSLRQENNSFLKIRNRFCLNRGKSLRQCEEICELHTGKKSAKKGSLTSSLRGLAYICTYSYGS
jgi:hypothetical protein